MQQNVLHDGLAGSKTRLLQISGAPIAGHGMSLDDMHACFVACIGVCQNLWSTTIMFHMSTVRAEIQPCHNSVSEKLHVSRWTHGSSAFLLQGLGFLVCPKVCRTVVVTSHLVRARGWHCHNSSNTSCIASIQVVVCTILH